MNTWDDNSTDELVPGSARTHFYFGVGLAILSSGFIGSSFIIKKKALIRLQKYGRKRAGAGGFGYLRESIWWAGLFSMGIGEAANFAAYAFAPATLVTPLGALSVLVSSILASIYLNEHINLLGKIGCLLCILGSTVLVLHSPKEEQIQNLDELMLKLQEPVFIIYVTLVISSSMFIGLYVGPKYGRVNVSVYILLCSIIGSLTVMGCKTLGIAIKQTLEGNNEMGNALTWLSLLTVIICIMVQMNYLNKALDLFNTGLVTPIYYVFFTTFVILASAILFQEWESLSNEDIVGSLCGFSIVIIAIFLLNAFKDLDITYHDVGQILKPQRKLLNQSEQVWNSSSEDGLLPHNDCKNHFKSNVTRSM